MILIQALRENDRLKHQDPLSEKVYISELCTIPGILSKSMATLPPGKRLYHTQLSNFLLQKSLPTCVRLQEARVLPSHTF